MRVILRADITDSDRIFRLQVKPYTGNARLDGAAAARKSSAVRILLGYDLLLLAPPPPRSSRMSRYGETVARWRSATRGNTNVLLRRIVQCDGDADPDTAAEGTCEELTPTRLYPGQTHRVALPRRRLRRTLSP